MKQKLEAHGEYPESAVYKAFSKIEHVKDFLDRGVFRMGSLHSYRVIEDNARQDRREGHGHIQVPGMVTVGYFSPGDPEFFETAEEQGLQQHHMEMGNPIYIFSTSIEGVDTEFLKSHFGRFVIRIDNPRELAVDITSYLETRNEKFAGGIEGRVVVYNHGEIVTKELSDWERHALSYYQKPTDFSDEKEFRFIAINMDTPSQRRNEDYIVVDLGGPIDYASLV